MPPEVTPPALTETGRWISLGVSSTGELARKRKIEAGRCRIGCPLHASWCVRHGRELTPTTTTTTTFHPNHVIGVRGFSPSLSLSLSLSLFLSLATPCYRIPAHRRFHVDRISIALPAARDLQGDPRWISLSFSSLSRILRFTRQRVRDISHLVAKRGRGWDPPILSIARRRSRICALESSPDGRNKSRPPPRSQVLRGEEYVSPRIGSERKRTRRARVFAASVIPLVFRDTVHALCGRILSLSLSLSLSFSFIFLPSSSFPFFCASANVLRYVRTLSRETRCLRDNNASPLDSLARSLRRRLAGPAGHGPAKIIARNIDSRQSVVGSCFALSDRAFKDEPRRALDRTFGTEQRSGSNKRTERKEADE